MFEENILDDVYKEQMRQLDLWGTQRHDHSFWLTILMEEVGEAAKAILESDNLEEELIQVAAVTCSWIRDMRMSAEGIEAPPMGFYGHKPIPRKPSGPGPGATF